MRYTRFAPMMLVAALAGCSLFNKTDPNAALIADARSPITDVPVPAGFTMTKDSTSKLVPGNSLRFVDHRYRGEDQMLPVVKFYKDELPPREWKFVDQTQTSGKEVMLHFAKNNEDCSITVTKRAVDTLIHIRIDPAGRKANQ